jgi:hypothetical protein
LHKAKSVCCEVEKTECYGLKHKAECYYYG